MKVTLITATYNSARYLTDSLESVASQTCPNIEHLVVDGGSSDETLKIVKNAPSVTRWISEPDEGIYDALNKGIKMATGDIIGFLHSDDLLASSKTIENILNVFSQHKGEQIGGVYGDLEFVQVENIQKVIRRWKSKPYNVKNLKYGWMPPHPTLFLKKEIYYKYGGFDTSFNIAGDFDFMLRIMKDGKFNYFYFPEYITKMRIGGASTRGIKEVLTIFQEDRRALKKNGFKNALSVLLQKKLRKLPQFYLSGKPK